MCTHYERGENYIYIYIYLYFIYIYIFYMYTCVIRGETNRYVAYNACTYVRVQYKR